MKPTRLLILAVVTTLGSARLTQADAPVYQGTITSPSLCSPRGFALSASGDLFVGSACPQHVEQFTLAGGLLGTWGFPVGYLGSPNGVAMDGASNLYVTDYDGGRIFKLTSSGTLISQWGGSFVQPIDVAVDGSGNMFVTGSTGKVQELTSSGVFVKELGAVGTGVGMFQRPNGVGLDGSGRIYVSDWIRMRILRFLPSGDFDMEFAVPFNPSDVAVGPDGNLYVIGVGDTQVHEYSSAGDPVQTFGPPSGLSIPFRIAINPTGTILVSDQGYDGVAKFQIDPSTAAVPSTLGRIKAMYR